jgi:hypothetical protein
VPQYDFVSPCGPEINWVRAEDTAIVFQDLTQDGWLPRVHLISVESRRLIVHQAI